MSAPRTFSALLLATFLAVAGCSSAPAAPPAYKLTGDACSAVPLDDYRVYTGSAPDKKPETLKPGLQGGNCTMDFDGDGGLLKLTTFIAIHPDGETPAKAMYDDFKKSDTDSAATPTNDTTVSDLKDLGSAAYLSRQHDDKTPWKANDVWLYKFGVRHGSLVLTVTAAGYARTPQYWPATEQDLEGKFRATVEGIMKNLAG
jgi:hypothetical protein